MSTYRENIIIHDRLYVETNNIPKKRCTNQQNVMNHCSSYSTVNEEKEEQIPTIKSYESFDSWIEDDLLSKERDRAIANKE